MILPFLLLFSGELGTLDDLLVEPKDHMLKKLQEI
jgi:hypothetical protein